MAAGGWRGEDLGVLAGRLLFAVQDELFSRLHGEGFDDIVPRHGVVLAYLRLDGIRATDLARLSGQVKQVVGLIVDDLERLGYVERRPDPVDRRAKLIVPTTRGRAQMAAADAIMADIMDRHARVLGKQEFRRFIANFREVVDHQRAMTSDDSGEGPNPR
ncbi:MarR family winged helix-turn-helix transcriptional regulator [Candidatus Mycobacterium wuenschmannii]|uniref:MarR family winged helix-turn-helix transcriptional regulator n=1 Tax=Candidatus Mycobacterium wuenschmannii TaxID=3027808 RepID=A0ABY8VSY3_9MYCO|nr:MarR family winged helix-turn-helix transcriptional regulator [Candidatus Mycobacterium wuenschmannii]WIM86734.1 MarR family winged helix-turn-helix transcriptional regulator [Candidatus Mycobacterium wuenschmannii]